MSGQARKRLLLGPQRPVTNLGTAFAKAGFPDGPVAVISAAWQDAEGDIDDVQQLIPRPLVDLRLYHRAEEVFAADSALREAYRERQDQLKELQRLYGMRLQPLMIAARRVLRAEGDPAMIAVEQKHAVAQLRALDRHHLQCMESVKARFDADIRPESSEMLAAQTAGALELLAGCETVLITGGNVLVLLNRLRLFGVDRLLGGKHLVAWSAGAMVLGERVVLFHDRTPLGRRDPEVFDAGGRVLPAHVFLPDPKRRLRKNDTVRASLMCRRFAPEGCVTLDSGSELQFEGQSIRAAEAARKITRAGRFERIKTA